MNRPFLRIKLVATIFAFSLLIVSCSDDDETPAGGDQDITQQDIQRSLEVEEISNFIDGMTLDNLSTNRSSKSTNECITFSGGDNGYTISFDNCDFEGETVNGSMTVSTSFDNDVVTSSVTFDNLSYGGNEINGTKTTTYSLDTTGGNFTYTVTSDISITFADGTTASENGTKTYEITGLGTAEAAYAITGNWNVTIGSDAYTLVADPALKGTFDCAYITSGILTMTKNGATATIDYGDGTCDNLATATLPDGTSVEIEL